MVVCPMCAEITGVEAEELAPGIQMIEDRKQIFDHLHVDSVVLTYRSLAMAQYETSRAEREWGESWERRPNSRRPWRIPVYVYQTSKARQWLLTGLVEIETGCGTRLNGGGGNRTRVPRHIHGRFYVCSRCFEFSLPAAPIDRVRPELAENRF